MAHKLARILSGSLLPLVPYSSISNELGLYLRKLDEYLRRLSSQLGDQNISGPATELGERLVVIEGDITAVEGDVSTIEGDISTIEGDISTIEGSISTIEGDISDLETAVSGFTANDFPELVYEEMVSVTQTGVYTASEENWSGRHISFEMWSDTANMGTGEHLYADPADASDVAWSVDLGNAQISVVVETSTGHLEINVWDYTGPAFKVHILVYASKRKVVGTVDRTV